MRLSFHSFDRVCGWFWRRVALSTAVSPKSLGLFRWLFGLSLLAIAAPHSAWIHEVPAGLFDPPVASLAYLSPGFPAFPTFFVLDAVQLLSLLCITLGYRTRVASVVYVCTDIFTANFRYSFGKLDRDFLPDATLLCMLYSHWGDYYSLDARRSAPRDSSQSELGDTRALALLGVVIAFGMFSAGLPKLVTWVDFNLRTSGFLCWYLPNYYGIGRDPACLRR